MLGPSAARALSAELEHAHHSRRALWLGDGESGHHRDTASPVPRDGGPFPGGGQAPLPTAEPGTEGSIW